MCPLCFLIALDRIFQRRNPRTAGISITDTLQLNKLEYADDVALIDDNCTEASERLSSLSTGAGYEGGLVVATHKSFGQHVQKARRMCRTTEEEVDEIDLLRRLWKEIPLRELRIDSPPLALQTTRTQP